ncbi:hypothetical protein C8R44DRAFT_744285 [Mycena epipterygia]|nr:hypothetical protein C8R44DRAFT_744285 [Mycena epipterygia]
MARGTRKDIPVEICAPGSDIVEREKVKLVWSHTTAYRFHDAKVEQNGPRDGRTVKQSPKDGENRDVEGSSSHGPPKKRWHEVSTSPVQWRRLEDYEATRSKLPEDLGYHPPLSRPAALMSDLFIAAACERKRSIHLVPQREFVWGTTTCLAVHQTSSCCYSSSTLWSIRMEEAQIRSQPALSHLLGLIAPALLADHVLSRTDALASLVRLNVLCEAHPRLDLAPLLLLLAPIDAKLRRRCYHPELGLSISSGLTVADVSVPRDLADGAKVLAGCASVHRLQLKLGGDVDAHALAKVVEVHITFQTALTIPAATQLVENVRATESLDQIQVDGTSYNLGV